MCKRMLVRVSSKCFADYRRPICRHWQKFLFQIHIYTRRRCMVNTCEKHKCAHSVTTCGRSHTSAQHSSSPHSIFNVHYSVPSNESHEWQHFNTQTLTPTTTTTKKHECAHQIERLNTGKSNLKPGVYAYVSMCILFNMRQQQLYYPVIDSFLSSSK